MEKMIKKTILLLTSLLSATSIVNSDDRINNVLSVMQDKLSITYTKGVAGIDSICQKMDHEASILKDEISRISFMNLAPEDTAKVFLTKEEIFRAYGSLESALANLDTITNIENPRFIKDLTIAYRSYDSIVLEYSSFAESPRTLRVSVQTDKLNKTEKEQVYKMVKRATANLDSLNIHIQVKKQEEIRMQPYLKITYLDSLTDKIAEKRSKDIDINLIFTRQSFWSDHDSTMKLYEGLCYFKSGVTYNFFSVRKNTERTYKILLHEIAHLFNADHIENPKAIMNPYDIRADSRWDPLTKKIIMSNRWKSWNQGYPSKRTDRTDKIKH